MGEPVAFGDVIKRLRALGDRASLGQTLSQLGSAYLSSGDLATAIALLGESAALLEAVDFRWDYGLSVYMLGDAMLASDPGEARRCYEQSLAAFRAVGDPFGIAIAITGLGGLAMRDRDYATARTLFEEGLALRRAAGHRWDTAISLTSLGELARYQGEPERARGYLEEGLALFRALGDAERTAWTLYNLGMVAIQTGDAPAASAALAESLALRAEQGNGMPIAQTIAALAQLALLEGDAERAARLLGAVDATRAARQLEPPTDQDGEAERGCRARVAAALGAQAYAAALDRGRQLTTLEITEPARGH